MNTEITIEVPQEIRHRAEARAKLEGTTVTEVLQRQLAQFAAGLDETPLTAADAPRQGARFIKISEFDPNWRPTAAEIEQSRAYVAEAQKLAEKIGQQWPEGISAVDAIREDRREL